MKLKSYFNPTRDSRLSQTVEVRLATDAAPNAPFVLLGDLIHEEGDNASGHQKHSVSHAIFAHVQEQVFLKHELQDMQRIRITTGGAFKLLNRIMVDPGVTRNYVGAEHTVTVTLDPTGATTNGVKFKFSNPSLVTVLANTGNGVIKFKSLMKGELLLEVTVDNIYQTIPFLFSEELQPISPPVVAVESVTIAPTSKSLVVGATQQLTPTVLPANASVKTVTYVSSTPAVASVSSTGLVTALTVGSTNVTCSTTDGAKTAICAVTVTAA